MSIRLRRVDGTLIAICAARSVEKEGDVYLDDEMHMALSRKYWQDYPELGVSVEPHIAALTEQEESNNAGRDSWEVNYGENRQLTTADKYRARHWPVFKEMGIEPLLFDDLTCPWVQYVTIRVLYALANAGIRTRAAVKAHGDLRSVPRIGETGIALISSRLGISL